jgi:hypothetical protein
VAENQERKPKMQRTPDIPYRRKWRRRQRNGCSGFSTGAAGEGRVSLGRQAQGTHAEAGVRHTATYRRPAAATKAYHGAHICPAVARHKT